MASACLTNEQRQFMAEFAALMTPWGMSPSLASIYAFLLVSDEPATLDMIAAQIGIAKSSVSTGTRTLERYGLARRHSEPGSKRIRYAASENCSGFLRSQAALMAEIGRLADSSARRVASGAALRRLHRTGSFYTEMARTIMSRIEVLADEHARAIGAAGRRPVGKKAG